MMTPTDAKITSTQNWLFLRHLDRRCVGIAILPRDSVDVTKSPIGSGTCISCDGRFFIATAAHNVADVPTDDIYIAAFSEPASERIPVVAKGHTKGDDSDNIDVAWLEIEPSAASKMPRQWIEIARCDPRFRGVDRRRLFVYGYPAKLATGRHNNKNLHLQGFGCATDVLPPEKRASVPAGQPDDLFLSYPSNEELWPGTELASLPAAPGMSGGGIWCVREDTTGVWAPDIATLVGIETAWSPGRYLRGTAIHHWLRLFVYDHADLRKPVAEQLGVGWDGRLA